MKVFLSWSGDRSRSIAETLRETLPLLMNAVQPWMSELDIDKGERWNTVLADVLGNAKIGIFCLTGLNINKPALLFEGGAISKSVGDSRVCVLLDGMEPSSISWPWSQFQSTRLHEQKDMFKMLTDINKWLGEAGEPALGPEQFTKQLNVWWPLFQKELEAKPAGVKVQVPERSEKDMLIEILELLRSQTRDAIQTGVISRVILREREEVQKTLEMQKQELEAQKQELEARIRRILVKKDDTLRDCMAEALEREGHSTAAAQLMVAQVRFDLGSGVCDVDVETRPSMTALTFSPDAVKTMTEAARSAGFPVAQMIIHPAPPPTKVEQTKQARRMSAHNTSGQNPTTAL